MAEWLVLRLPRAPDSPAEWLLAAADGQPLSSAQTGSLTEAAAATGGRQVCALVPSGDVLSTDVELPVKGGARLLQVVPYALEEQLATDVESLHFAVGARVGDTPRTAVAVVARSLIDEWMAALKEHGIEPQVLCADSALLPVNPGHGVLWAESDLLCVRRADGSSPLALPLGTIAEAMEVAYPDPTMLAAEHLLLYIKASDWQRRSTEFEALRSRVASLKVQLLNTGVLPLLAPQLPAGAFINLLQGAYAPQHSLGSQVARWRLAAVLAAVLVALHVSGQALGLMQLKHTERGLDDSLRALAASALPGDSGGGDLRARVQQRLASADVPGSGFLGALGALARAVSSVNGASVQALSFRDGVLELRLHANDAESLERVNQAIAGSGWRAELTSGAPAANGYEGRIQMHGAGAR
jgi:general secretion pathway protein L